MDKENRFSDYATVMKVEDVGSQNLPFAGDWNAGTIDCPTNGFADYCGNAEGDNYAHCNGAKIWAIKSSDLGTETESGSKIYNVLWTGMGNFYWETELIEFNTDGQITVYPGEVLDFTPEYTPSVYANGDYTINTTIA